MLRKTELPQCDICTENDVVRNARYDARTRDGKWAFLCPTHFHRFGVGLGVGRGRKLPEFVQDENKVQCPHKLGRKICATIEGTITLACKENLTEIERVLYVTSVQCTDCGTEITPFEEEKSVLEGEVS